MIVFARPIYPEASQILQHYCFGNGETLHLDPEYISHSPVVVSHVKKMKVGESREIRFNQKQDWRLSYALNPFTISKTKEKIKIHQYIQFDKTQRDYTVLNLGLFKIPVSDNIVHTFKCKPFMVETEYKNIRY